MTLATKFIDENIAYSGRELAPHWISARTGVFGPAVVAFRGRCMVETDELVDMEDRRQKARIEAQEMLHFLGEWFDGDLALAIARQRLFIAGFAEELGRRIELPLGTRLERSGNDLYVAEASSRRKLSVSIVTASPVSTLFHFGVNINPSGAPVPAIGLADLRVDPTALAKAVLSFWGREWESMAKARCKVMPR